MRFGFRELVFTALLLAVPVASWFVVFQPRQEQIDAARQEVETKRNTLARLAAVTARVDDLRARIEEGRKALERLERKIPDRDGVDAILQQITELAMANQLVVRSVKGERAISAPLHMELPLRMIIEGEFEGLYRFLSELESLERITRVHHLQVTRVVEGRATRQENLGSLKADLVLSIFFDPGDDSSQMENDRAKP
ncbi:MAG: type 4a pilus biogenesis protein PilO [Phycisphaerales bacterium]|jgi:type IV pilus assembly protein PilO|nr:type 4a pilus biogenesis protein PilO [Planctomycetota bacterium]